LIFSFSFNFSIALIVIITAVDTAAQTISSPYGANSACPEIVIDSRFFG
jgi:hypothetical protein